MDAMDEFVNLAKVGASMRPVHKVPRSYSLYIIHKVPGPHNPYIIHKVPSPCTLYLCIYCLSLLLFFFFLVSQDLTL